MPDGGAGRLPFIDEYSLDIAAGRQDTWVALSRVVRSDLGAPPPLLTKLLGLEPAARSGAWNPVVGPDAALPGFAVEEARDPERLALWGRHRFSAYALVFELDETGDAVTRLRAQTWATFPGLQGHAYRALVIGTRAHRIVVRRLLRRVAQRV